MTFLDIVSETADRLNLTSEQAISRIGREVNIRYRRITSSLGLITSRPIEVSKAVTVGNRKVVFSEIEKVVSVHHRLGGASPLTERTFDDLGVSEISATGTADSGTATTVVDSERTETTTDYWKDKIIEFTNGSLLGQTSLITAFNPTTDTITFAPAVSTSVVSHTYNILGGRIGSTPREYAVYAMGANTVTIYLDSLPDTAYALYASGLDDATTLSGAAVPAFSESFHDVLILGAVADELRKMEKFQLARDAESDFERRLSDLRMFIAKSAYLDIYQGKTDTNWWQR